MRINPYSLSWLTRYSKTSIARSWAALSWFFNIQVYRTFFSSLKASCSVELLGFCVFSFFLGPFQAPSPNSSPLAANSHLVFQPLPGSLPWLLDWAGRLSETSRVPVLASFTFYRSLQWSQGSPVSKHLPYALSLLTLLCHLLYCLRIQDSVWAQPSLKSGSTA